MSVQYPYRAVIFGEEHTVQGWRGRNLVTDTGSFTVRHIYSPDWPIQDHQLVEVATVQADGKGGWLVNGYPLPHYLNRLCMSERFQNISTDETLKLHKIKIFAGAWFGIPNSPETSRLVDLLMEFWHGARQRIGNPKQGRLIAPMWDLPTILDTRPCQLEKGGWSSPHWLSEFRPVEKKPRHPKKQIEDAAHLPQLQQAAKIEVVEGTPAPEKIAQKKVQEPAPSAPDYFFSYKKAAQYIGVTERTIKNWKRDNWLKVEKIGRKVRIAKTDLEKSKNRK